MSDAFRQVERKVNEWTRLFVGFIIIVSVCWFAIDTVRFIGDLLR